MGLDEKLKALIIFEIFLAVITVSMIFLLPEEAVESYRLWEIFPAGLAALITTYGLKSMRLKT